MEEYWDYIKWLGKLLYANELKILGNENVNCVFHDDVDYKVLNNDIIFIIDCDSIDDTIIKLFNYKKKIEKNFKIMDMSVFKGNDNVNFSETYLIAVYCVDYNKYSKNIEKYDNAFKNNLDNVKKIEQKFEKIIEQENDMKTEINNIPQNNNNTNINELYSKVLDSIIEKNEVNLKEFRDNRIKNMNEKFEFKNNTKSINNRFLLSVDIGYIDKVLNLKDKKAIKGYKIIKGKLKKIDNNIIEGLYDDYYSSFVIIDCINDKINNYYSNIFRKINSKIIVISSNRNEYEKDIIVIKYLKKALELLKGCKIIYVNNSNMDIMDENIINIKVHSFGTIKPKDSVEDIKKKIIESENGIYAFANLDHLNSVKVLTGTFLNFNGDNYYSGGAERYLIDLYDVCKQLNMKLRVYQKANFDFLRFYNDIEIVGVSDNNISYNYEYEQNIDILNNYNIISKNKTKINIYSSFMECYGKALSPSIGISHGVAWDYKDNTYKKNNLNEKSWIIDSAISCDKLVSVDTNTANYFQTVDYRLGNSTEVVPNYVDIEEFCPKKDNKEKSNLILLYPRRLSEARGLYLLLNIVDDLIKKHEKLEIHFVGKGVKENTSKIQEKIDKWGNDRIKMYNCPPEKMYEVYQKADISVIPTLYSEGTSLSCLEAMSTENAVIATRIGGLTDLIINNYNGKLIEPNENCLYNAINEFIENPELMNKCRKNAREIAKEFNKSIWIDKWKKIIKNYAKKVVQLENINYNITMIYVSDTKLKSKKLKEIIMEELLNNNVVYIVNSKVDVKESYGRLQYLNGKEDLYKTPYKILIDRDYSNSENIAGEYIDI